MWNFPTTLPVVSSPVIDASGNVVVGSWGVEGYLYKVNGTSGTLMWSYPTTGGVVSTPALDAVGDVFLGSGNYLQKVNGPSGTLEWRYSTPTGVVSSPALDVAGDVYVGSDDNCLYKVNGSSGTLVRRYQTGGSISSSPAIDAFGNVFVGSSDGYLQKVDGRTGAWMWSFFLYYKPTSITATGDIFAGSGYLYKFSPDCGSEGLFHFNHTSSLCDPLCTGINASVYFGDTVVEVTEQLLPFLSVLPTASNPRYLWVGVCCNVLGVASIWVPGGCAVACVFAKADRYRFHRPFIHDT